MADGKEGKGKYGALIQQARNPDNQMTTLQKDSGKPDDQTTSKPEEKQVNLCVKVPISWRRHWAAEAKRQGITMTDVMVEALIEKFGKPN